MNETMILELSLDAEERTLMVGLLEHALGETRVEAHRTHTPAYRKEVLENEALIRRLLTKLRAERR